jgi:hypothetical protein
MTASLTPQVLEHDLSPDVVTALDALAAGAPPSPLERKGSNGRSNGSRTASGKGSVAAWAAGYLARLLATGRSGANGSSGDARGCPGSEANRSGAHAARPAAEGLSSRGEAWSTRGAAPVEGLFRVTLEVVPPPARRARRLANETAAPSCERS